MAKIFQLPAYLSPFLHVVTLFVTSFGSAFLVFLTQLILVRLLSAPDYGQFVALLAVINLLTPVSTYGVGWFWLRAFGEEGWAGFRWLGPSVRLMTLTCGIGAVVLLVYTWGQVDLGNRAAVCALAVLVLLGQVLAETTSARLQLEERFVALALWQSMNQSGRFAVAAGLLACGLNGGMAPLIGYASVGGLLTSFGIASLNQMYRGCIVLRGHGNPPAVGRDQLRPSMSRLATQSTPYCLWTVFYSMYFQSVVILLAVLVGKETAGVYNIAFQIISAAHLLPGIIYSKYLFGKVFRWSEHDVTKFYAAFHIGVLGMSGLGVLSMFAVIAVSPVLIPILFGPDYVGSVQVTIWLSITILTRFLQSAYGSLFFSKDSMKWQVIYGGIAAAFCVSVNVILLPHFGLSAAIITQIATEFLLLGLYMHGANGLHSECGLWHSFRPTIIRRSWRTLMDASLS